MLYAQGALIGVWMVALPGLRVRRRVEGLVLLLTLTVLLAATESDTIRPDPIRSGLRYDGRWFEFATLLFAGAVGTALFVGAFLWLWQVHLGRGEDSRFRKLSIADYLRLIAALALLLSVARWLPWPLLVPDRYDFFGMLNVGIAWGVGVGVCCVMLAVTMFRHAHVAKHLLWILLLHLAIGIVAADLEPRVKSDREWLAVIRFGGGYAGFMLNFLGTLWICRRLGYRWWLRLEVMAPRS